MHQSLDQRQSSTAIMSPQNRALQQDPMLNPASLWAIEGEALWRQPMGQQACSSCHGDAEITMKGIAARFPRYSSGKLMNLEMRINACRTLHQKQSAFAFESAPLLSLATYIGKQSAGHPIESESTPLNQADLQSGAKQFHQRIGQINVSCAQCHDARWGQKLAGVSIPQAHPTGYPIYRLEWQSVGSLQRRLRNCMTAVRAEPYDYGSPELLRLELYLAWRARGMPMETPAVRP